MPEVDVSEFLTKPKVDVSEFMTKPKKPSFGQKVKADVKTLIQGLPHMIPTPIYGKQIPTKEAVRTLAGMVPGYYSVSELIKGHDPLSEHPLLTAVDVASLGVAGLGIRKGGGVVEKPKLASEIKPAEPVSEVPVKPTPQKIVVGEEALKIKRELGAKLEKEGGTTLYSGINPQEIINTIKSIVPEKPEGVEIQAPATPELHTAYVLKMPQNVFKDVPEAAKLVYEVRQTERSFASAPQRAFEQIPTLLKVTDPIEGGKLRRIAENYSTLKTKGLIDKLAPERRQAVEEWIGLSNSYRQRMWKELKQAGYKVPDKPEEWGIENYVSHAQSGNYLIKANDKVVAVASNRIEAYKMAQDWVDKHPNSPKPVITGKDFVPSEAIAFVSGKQKRAILTAFNKKLEISYEEAAQVLRGVIGKTPKRRFTPIRMQRLADLPLPRNTSLADRARFYVATAERYLHYNKLRRVGQKMIDKVPPSPYKAELQDYFKSIEQPPSIFELTLDQKLQKIPVIGDYVRPFFLRRRIGNITNSIAVLKLANPRFWIQNHAQTYTTVYPVVGEKIYLDAWKRVLSGDSQLKATIKKYNAVPDPDRFTEFGLRQYANKVTKTLLKPGALTEQGNQAVAFWSGLRYAKETLKLPQQQAVKWAHNFVDRTQFPSTPGTTAKLFRMGGVATKPFTQFKPFSFRIWENAILPYGFGALKTNPKVSARFWTTQALWGGVKLATNPFTWGIGIIGYKTYKELEDNYGKQVADGIVYGLPGMIGIDLTSSLAANFLWGSGNMYEKIGQTVAGPAVSDIIRTGEAIGQKDVTKLTGISPLIQAPIEATKALKGQKLVTDERGRGQYEVTPTQRIARIGGLKPTAQSVEQMKSQAIRKVQEDYTKTRQEVLDLAVEGKVTEAVQKLRQWNQEHDLKMKITADEVREEKKKKQLTRTQRTLDAMSNMRKALMEKELRR